MGTGGTVEIFNHAGNATTEEELGQQVSRLNKWMKKKYQEGCGEKKLAAMAARCQAKEAGAEEEEESHIELNPFF